MVEAGRRVLIGREFELNQGGRMRQVTIAECVHATGITIAYTIQSEAVRQLRFFRLGQLDGYARLGDGYIVEVVALGPLPCAG